MPMAPPDVSVIVPTRNRCGVLQKCLEHLAALTTRRTWDLWVVDNGSSDGTIEVADRVCSSLGLRFDVLSATRPGASHARNAGIWCAKGRLVAFTDDDCYVAPDWLDRLVAPFEDPRMGYVAGRILLHDPRDYPVSVREETDPVEVGPGLIVPTSFALTANLAVRREVLLAIGGFDSRMDPAEDADLVGRIALAGYKGRYEPQALVRHHHGRRVNEDLRRRMREYDYGSGALYGKWMLDSRCRQRAFKWWRKTVVDPNTWPVERDVRPRHVKVGREVLGASKYILGRLLGFHEP